ncbi:MAG: extracellular solute-binding protein [Lachnospiraceae bacterium]|jgi:raffinose/stachyose/melibiose transport system substrate-binding protein|nr:extracellular solute-binding protein [Lachnospiraceae bacterium]
MRTRNKVIALLLAGVLTFSLAGCGAGGNDSAPAEPAADTAAEPEEAGAPEAEEADTGSDEHEPVTVVWLNQYNEDGIIKWTEWVKEQVESQYPYITLDMQTYSADEIDSILLTKIASDDAPQIFSCRTASIPEYVDAGYVYDLSNEPWIGNVAESFVQSAVVNGIQVYVPMDTNYSGIFYNKDVFEENGLEIPETADELYAVCDALKAKGIEPFSCGFGELWTLEEYFFPIWMTYCVGGYGGFDANRAWFTDLEAGNTTFTGDEAFAAAFSTLYALRDYFSEDPMTTDWNTALGKVATGEGAMICNGSWTIDGILSINPDANIGTFAIPLTNDVADTVLVEGPGTGPMCFNTEDPELLDASLKVFEVMYSPESGQSYAELGNKISTFKNADLSFNPAFGDMQAYSADGLSWSKGGVTQFGSEGYNIFDSRVQEYLMKDSLDIEGLTAALDSDFAAMRN